MIKRTLSREEIHVLAPPQSINIRLSLRGKDYVNIPIFHDGTSVLFFTLCGAPVRQLLKHEEQPDSGAYWLHIDHAAFILLAFFILLLGEVW
ncbi:hypothetical protein JTE90_021077 [Oedothorax gibbosus]|uniref:Uncharacterized protein n=1 Tax=Oedothorax gibbosus TaxID=931172 RepID=A0AAV6VTI8_9ARAC|nr:hypothetical protein JTE90_021077 [Oedothorax gibbosus]